MENNNNNDPRQKRSGSGSLPVWSVVLIAAAAVVLLCVVSCTACMGCGACAVMLDSDTDTPDSDSQQPLYPETAADEGDLGEYHVRIKAAYEADDFNGDDVLVVEYEFTNNSEKPIAFFTAISDSAFQNGVQLGSAYVLEKEDAFDLDTASREITKGTTYTVFCAYKLNDDHSPVTVYAEELFSFDDKRLSKTFAID